LPASAVPLTRSLARSTRRFRRYYYDPLGQQDEEIKLTLDWDKGKDIDLDDVGDENDLTPPLDKVVRTKWGKVDVDWNGAEKIL
jgi:hypothetical protein